MNDDIREPDDIKKEQLIEDTSLSLSFNFNVNVNENNNIFDKEIEEAMKLSMQDVNQLQSSNDKYEEDLIKYYYDEKKKRSELFEPLLCKLQRLLKIDNEAKLVYDIIEPIIESYCCQFITTCELDIESYNMIFELLRNIRLDQKSINKLKTIILHP